MKIVDSLFAFIATKLANIVGNNVIVGTQTISIGTSGSIADKASASISGSFTAIDGATSYIAIPISSNFGVATSNPTINGLNISATCMNVSGATHTVSVRYLIIGLGGV